MKKYKEKYKTGMIFRSKKYPWTDLVIDFVSLFVAVIFVLPGNLPLSKLVTTKL